EAEAEYRQQEDERRRQGREHREPHAPDRALEIDVGAGENEQLDDPEADEIRHEGAQAPAIPAPEFPGDGESGRHAAGARVPTWATNASSSVRNDCLMALSGALSAILPWLIMLT